MKPTAFRSAAAFRAWLEKHHATESELMIRLFKNHARERGMGYADAVDEALCFGWIDGVRRALDADSFTQRFSPRKPNSIWSAINIRHVARLEKEGRMRAPGRAAFARRDASRSRMYSFESRPKTLPPAYQRRFRATSRAWDYFLSQPPGYRRLTAFWILSAKREETRERRLAVLIDCSARGKHIPGLERTPKAARAAPPARRRAKGASR